MWYLTILAFGVAAVGAWFFFKKATPDVVLDVNKDKVTDADARAAVTAVVEQVKVIAAETEAAAKKATKRVKK
jgi:hypothetical protein